MSRHSIIHVEFATANREASGKFFSELFGWDVKQYPEMGYTTFSTGENEVGGGFNPVGEDNPIGKVVAYIHTDDIDESLRRVEQLGGKCLRPKEMIPTVGWFAVFSDPGGVEMSLLQPVMEGQ